MKKALPILIVTTTFLVACLWWFQDFYTDPPGISPVVTVKPDDSVGDQPVDAELETAAEGVSAGESEAAVGRGQARNVALVPGSDPDTPQAEQAPESEFQKFVKKMVETSLEGTVEDSIVLGQLMNQCGGVPRNEKQFKNNLQTMNRKFHPGKKLNLAGGQNMSFASINEYEVHMQEKYDQCQDIRGIFKNDLHKQIARQAAKGNKIARYLYAMWPPSLGGRFRGGKMPEWLEYQNEALSYTWQNIDEGEPLGLMAFGQSFNNVDGGFFTPTNHRYAQAFFLAAKKCGLESTWLDATVNKYIVDLSVELAGIKLDRTEIRADELKELFCQ